MRKWQAGALGIVVLAASALGVKAAVDAKRPRGTDTAQIQQMLFEGERAAERGEAAAIHRFISPHYRDEVGLKDTQVKYQINRYLRERPGLDITIPTHSIQIDIAPDGRTATCSFLVTAASANATTQDVPIHLQLAREQVYYYWLFPGEEWKVVSAGGYPAMDF